MARFIQKSAFFSNKSIEKSSGSIQSLAALIGTTDLTANARRQIVKVKVGGQAAAFYIGNSDHSDKVSSHATETWERDGSADLLDNTYVRAVADAAQTVAVELVYGT